MASDFDFDVGNRIVILAIEWFSGKRIFFDNIIVFGNRIVLGQPERHLKLGSATVAFVFGFVMSLYFYSESVRDILYL